MPYFTSEFLCEPQVFEASEAQRHSFAQNFQAGDRGCFWCETRKYGSTTTGFDPVQNPKPFKQQLFALGVPVWGVAVLWGTLRTWVKNNKNKRRSTN